MRMIMILTAVSLVLAGCAGSSGDDSSSTTPASAGTVSPGHTNPQPSTSAPPDYSKISCGSVEDCASACDVSHPFITETTVRQLVCGGIAGTASATCDAIVKFNQDGFVVGNTWCKSLMTSEVVELRSIGAKSCAETTGCADYCAVKYVPQSDQAIERAASANGSLNSGGTLKALIENHVLMAQLAACLAAPANFVIPGLP